MWQPRDKATRKAEGKAPTAPKVSGLPIGALIPRQSWLSHPLCNTRHTGCLRGASNALLLRRCIPLTPF